MIKLYPYQPLHYGEFVKLVEDILPGNLYLRAPYTVPFSYNGNHFVVEVDVPGTPVQIQIVNTKWSGGGDTPTVQIYIPAQDKNIITLYLGEGLNDIYATSAIGDISVRVAATHIATLLDAQAQELYTNSTLIIDETDNSLFSALSTRMVEHLLPFQSILPDVQTYRMLCAKLGIRATINDGGTDRGVRDLATALSVNTPIFIKERNEIGTIAALPEFNPMVNPLFNAKEDFSGWDVHVWLPNICMASWLAFIRLANNVRDVYELLSVSELTVTLNFNGYPERHQFPQNFLADECSLSYLVTQCFDNIRCYGACDVLTSIMICIHYPFDLRVEHCGALGAGFLDCYYLDESMVGDNALTFPLAGPALLQKTYYPPDGIRTVFQNIWPNFPPYLFPPTFPATIFNPITNGDIWMPPGCCPLTAGTVVVSWTDAGGVKTMYDMPTPGGWDLASDGNPVTSSIDYNTGQIVIDTGADIPLAATNIYITYTPSINNFDDGDPEAYDTSPGWVGLGTSGRFDHYYHACLDSFPWVSTLPSETNCCFPMGYTVTCIGDEYGVGQADIPIIITGWIDVWSIAGPIIMPV